MPSRESEALVLRTYPYREADLIVSFFSRDRGKLRGIARGVRRPKNRFGAALERLAHVRLGYFQKQTVELVRIDRGELLALPLVTQLDYPASLALDYVAEVAEEVLPDHEPNDAYFRLMALSVEAGRAAWADSGRASQGGAAQTGDWLWPTLTYFALWSVRLGGWLPPLNRCLETGVALAPDQTAWFDRTHEGLLSADVRSPDAWALSPDSRALAQRMLRGPLADFSDQPWSVETGADLRLFLNQRLEMHLEKRLRSLTLMAQLDSTAEEVAARPTAG